MTRPRLLERLIHGGVAGAVFGLVVAALIGNSFPFSPVIAAGALLGMAGAVAAYFLDWFAGPPPD